MAPVPVQEEAPLRSFEPFTSMSQRVDQFLGEAKRRSVLGKRQREALVPAAALLESSPRNSQLSFVTDSNIQFSSEDEVPLVDRRVKISASVYPRLISFLRRSSLQMCCGVGVKGLKLSQMLGFYKI